MSGTIMLDLVKCYEYISHNLLWLLGFLWDAPVRLLVLALEIYSAPRVIVLGQAYSRQVESSCRLTAGSRFANRFLKLVLLLPADFLQQR